MVFRKNILPLASWWIFQETDRIAQALWLTSTPTSDWVEFKFDQEEQPRRVRLQRFLSDFKRATD